MIARGRRGEERRGEERRGEERREGKGIGGEGRGEEEWERDCGSLPSRKFCERSISASLCHQLIYDGIVPKNKRKRRRNISLN